MFARQPSPRQGIIGHVVRQVSMRTLLVVIHHNNLATGPNEYRGYLPCAAVFSDQPATPAAFSSRPLSRVGYQVKTGISLHLTHVGTGCVGLKRAWSSSCYRSGEQFIKKVSSDFLEFHGIRRSEIIPKLSCGRYAPG